MRKPGLMMVCAALAALAGCAGGPGAGGGRDEIVFAGADMIRIRWNPQLTDERRVRAEAMAYCSGRPADEIPASAATEPGGLLSRAWQCQPFSGNGM